jgi:integrase
MSASEARRQAKRLLADMSAGVDPSVGRKAARQQGETLAEVLASYLARGTMKASSINFYRTLIHKHLGDWLARRVGSISSLDVLERHRQISSTCGNYAGNATMMVLRAVLRYARAALPRRADGSRVVKEIATDVLTEARAWNARTRRTRHLSPTEVSAYWTVLQRLPSQEGALGLRVLLLTGLRKGELLNLRWRDVDLDRRILHIRESKTGSFMKPIGPHVAAILNERYRHHKPAPGGMVLGVRNLETPMATASKRFASALNDETLKISPHDLRRTFISFGEAIDLSAYTLKRLVNHATKGDVTGGYIQISDARLAGAADRVEAAILTAIGVFAEPESS